MLVWVWLWEELGANGVVEVQVVEAEARVSVAACGEGAPRRPRLQETHYMYVEHE